jgi:hypothetical protein
MLGKWMEKIGQGSAEVQMLLHKSSFEPGDEIRGRYLL